VWSIALHDRPVGVERVWTTGDSQVRRRILAVLTDDGPARRRSAVALEGTSPTRAVRLWTEEGEVAAEGPAWWPLAAPPPEGESPVLDGDGAISPARVTRTADGLSIEGRRGRTLLTLDAAGRPSAMRWAGVTMTRLDGDVPDPPPLDVVAVLTRPAPAFPHARRSLVGRYRVGGEEVRVDVPTAAELPPERILLQALAARVDEGIAYRASPFGAAPGAGDCTEHAVAFVELARAEGLEARTAAGLLVVDAPPALVPHAWAEVKLGERWVPVDPALSQVPADAGHLRLGAWVDEVAAADGVPIEVLELR
jgi:hypothetical protein